MQDVGDVAQGWQLHTRFQTVEHRLFERGILEQLVQLDLPALAELDRGVGVIDDLETGRQLRLNRIEREDSRCERVQRLDGGVVELLHCPLDSLALFRCERTHTFPVQGFIQRLAHAIAEFGGCLFGERDRGELIGLDLASDDQVDDSVDHRGGLTGAGAGLDEERLAEIVGDAIALSLI